MSHKSCLAGRCFVLVQDFKKLCLTFSYRSVSQSSWGRQITSDEGSFKPRYLLWLKALIPPHCSLKQQEWHKHYPIFFVCYLLLLRQETPLRFPQSCGIHLIYYMCLQIASDAFLHCNTTLWLSPFFNPTVMPVLSGDKWWLQMGLRWSV